MENKDYKLKSGNILRIIQDPSAESPDKWGNEDMFLVYDHRQFTIEREGFAPITIFKHIQSSKKIEKLRSPKNNTDDELEAMEEWGEEVNDNYDKYHIFPVAAHIHSGVSLSLTDSLRRQGWDTSVTGFILVKKEEVVEGKKPKFTTEEEAKKYAEGLIETWNQYLSGDVYGFNVIKVIDEAQRLTDLIIEQYDKTRYLDQLGINFSKSMIKDILSKNLEETTTEKELESCWGFYGDNPEENGMLDHINDELLKEEQ
jgi:hypothetical protein